MTPIQVALAQFDFETVAPAASDKQARTTLLWITGTEPRHGLHIRNRRGLPPTYAALSTAKPAAFIRSPELPEGSTR
jgi:hypothetical protein